MIRKADSLFDVCLTCATFREAKALIEVISLQCDVRFTSSRAEYYEYYYTTVQNHKGEFLTIHVSWQSAYGPDKAIAHLTTVLNECNPRFVGMTGVCAGDKNKVKLGDLILANCAFMYDDVMIFEDSQQQYQQDVKLYYTNVDSTYFSKVRDVWAQLEMQQALPISREPSGEIPLHPTLLHITPMACVSTVRRDNPFHNIQKLVSETVAIDMEGASFYHTVARFSGPHSLVVKGVCDYADSEKNDKYHEYASKASAAYMVCFIKEYVTSDLTPAFFLSTDR